MADSLLEKRRRAAEALLEREARAAGPEAFFVAFTGGKDSTVALWLARRVFDRCGFGRVRALSLDTGCKFPEVTAFRDRLAWEWDVELTIVRPDVELASYPLAADPVACCRDLKVLPLQRAIRTLGVAALVTGIRRDEHPSRATSREVEPVDEPPHRRVNPLLDWTEMDIWACITGQGLPFCGLYAEGYRSLGCRPCTVKGGDGGEREGRSRAKEAVMGQLRSMGYF